MWRVAFVCRRYDLKQQIGSGAFGVVMKALDLQTGEFVAIKIIKARRAYSQQARREIKYTPVWKTPVGYSSSIPPPPPPPSLLPHPS
jgi:serine/threonine protein kinase